MPIVKYPTIHRINIELQEASGNPHVDGFIGPTTERYLREASKDYDGNSLLEFFYERSRGSIDDDSLHQLVERLPPQKSPDHIGIVPAWLQKARSFVGLKEIKGKEHNPQILKFWELCHLPFKTDEVAWCAGFVGGVLEMCGIKSSRSGMARSYLKWGKPCEHKVGAVVVYWRVSRHDPKGRGHVAFVDGELDGGFCPSLGGNQHDMVCTKPYPTSRILGYREPTN